MAAIDMFRGLAEMNLSTQPGANPKDPFVAAYPTFRTFDGTRDEIVLLRSSVARSRAVPHLKQSPGSLRPWDEDEVPQVFRLLNPANEPTVAALPTFTYGQSANRFFMNVVELFKGASVRKVVPAGTTGLTDLTKVEAALRGAHAWALASGFRAAFPTFRTVTGSGIELVAFPAQSKGVALNSGQAAGARRWSFASLNAMNDGGMDVASVNGEPVILNWVGDRLEEVRPPSTVTGAVDPGPDGTRRSPLNSPAIVLAATVEQKLHVLWSDVALFHGHRPLGTRDAWSFTTVAGRSTPPLATAGLVGPFGSVLAARRGAYRPDLGDVATMRLHAFPWLAYPPGPSSNPADPNATRNLLHAEFGGSTWQVETVDGDGATAAHPSHVSDDVGQSSAAVYESYTGTLHVFYSMTVAVPGGHARRLRYAENSGGVWVAATIDGSGSSTPPAVPGTGPTSANVGSQVQAEIFDGSFWVVYEDRTWGNLRCARGTRVGAKLTWEFHILDGGGHRGSTPNIVGACTMLQWDDHLSVFYFDEKLQAIRHAYRTPGASGWSYDLLDGVGGPDGRVADRLNPTISAAASLTTDFSPTTPIFVAYRWRSPAAQGTRWGLRLARFG